MADIQSATAEIRQGNKNIMSASATQGGHKQQYLPICPYNMVNFGLLAAEIFR